MDVGDPLVETTRIDAIQVWKWAADDPLSCFDNPLQVFPLCCSAAGVPDCTAASQDTFYGAAVESDEQLLRELVAFQGPQEKRHFWTFLTRLEVLRLQALLRDVNF